MANIVGTKWGSSTLGTPGGTVTWSIAGAGTDISRFGVGTNKSVSGDSFLSYDYEKVIANAFAEWSKYGDIEFKQVNDQGGAAGVGTTADIRIFFGAIPGGTAGFAFYPSSYGSAIAGDILFDTISKFETDPALFAAVALHEIGHTLGLGHVSENSIMTPSVKKIGLQPDDISGIQQIYGEQQGYEEDQGSAEGPTEPVGDSPDPDPAPQPDPEPPASEDNTSSPDDQKLVGTSGKDTLYGYDGDDTLIGRGGDDKLNGGRDDDRLDGGGGRDNLIGGSGDDTLNGNSGGDKLNGGGGNDKLNGGSSGDNLRGGGGNDTIEGGSGNDWMKGSSGGDIFVFDDGHGHDTISDFNGTSNSEKIDLSGLAGFNSIRDVRDAATQKNGNVLIETSSKSSILLQDVTLSQLGSGDFLFSGGGAIAGDDHDHDHDDHSHDSDGFVLDMADWWDHDDHDHDDDDHDHDHAHLGYDPHDPDAPWEPGDFVL